MVKQWIKAAWIYFLLAALLGLLLRWAFVGSIGSFKYTNLLHAHSHLMFMGWLHNSIVAALLYCYIPLPWREARKYQTLFWAMQFAVVGMFISFSLQGYAFFSIAFSTIHIVFSYIFMVFFFKDHQSTRMESKHHLSFHFIRLAFGFFILATLAPMALGPIAAMGFKSSPIYNLIIYFFLHFQYNGWFSFVLFGLFFWQLEQEKIPFPRKAGKYFLILMGLACLPAYALSTLWTQPSQWVYLIAFLSAMLQLIALGTLSFLIYKIRAVLNEEYSTAYRWLMLVVLLAFGLKIVLQFISAFPQIAELAYTVRNYTIAYLHLVFLPFISLFFVLWSLKMMKVVRIDRYLIWGFIFFLLGIFLTESWMIGQGVSGSLFSNALAVYYPLLFAFSIFFPLGIGLIMRSLFKPNRLKKIELL